MIRRFPIPLNYSGSVEATMYLLKEKLAMRFNIKRILPLALSLILPGLSLYNQTEWPFFDSLEFSQKWMIGSFYLYIWWHILWYINTRNSKTVQVLSLIGVFILQVGMVPATLYILGYEFEGQKFARTVLATILFIVIQFVIKAQANIARLELEKEQIQTENYKVQLKALRTKIDPHFLFNSLNTLRSMVRHHHDNSEEFIMNLSDYYRQILKHNENTTLPLSEELDMLQSYLFLMKSRNEEAVIDRVLVNKSWYAYHLPTLALQVVVENCFKHNSMTTRRPLRIEVHHTDDQYIAIHNNIQPKIGSHDSTGYGLDLLRKRYDLLKVHEGLIIEKGPDQFTVKLKLIKP